MNMKKLLFVLGLLPLFGCSKAAAPESPERLADEAYVSYFEKRLNGEDHGALYTAGTALTADRVALARDTVWNSWRAANRAFAEDCAESVEPDP